MTETRCVTFTAGSAALDRAAHLRDGCAGLMKEGARLLPLWQEKVLIDLSDGAPRLGWVAPLDGRVSGAAADPVFLGLAGGVPCFAADISALDEAAARERFGESAKFIDLRSVAGDLSAGDASVAATAKGIVGWHLAHRFCSRCGAASAPENGGWRRRCPACGGQHFPRTDPVVIMLILHGDEVLIGRQSRFLPGMYSLLAGFMEPGETIEDAVRRETREETSVEVGPVAYLGCQPWPFPSNLMLGCVGLARSTAITVDETELEDARWISRDRMRTILAGDDPEMSSPRRDAIARAILTDWVNGEIACLGEDGALSAPHRQAAAPARPDPVSLTE